MSSVVDAVVGPGSLKFPNWRRVLVWRVAGTSIVVGEVQGHLLDGVVRGNRQDARSSRTQLHISVYF